MILLQVCSSCGRFRKLDEYNCWSHWQDTRNFLDEGGLRIQKVVCENCQPQAAKQRQKTTALNKTRELYQGYAEGM